MSDTKQKLGIELSLTLDSKFGDLVKQIERSFGNVDLKGFEAKVAGVEGKVGKLAQEIAKITGGSVNKIQLDLDTSSINKKMSDASRRMDEFKNVVVSSNGKITSSLQSMVDKGTQITSIIKNTNKAYLDSGNQIQAIIRNTNAAAAAEWQSMLAAERLANSKMLAERKLAKQQLAAVKEDRSIQVEQGTSILAAERNTNRAMLAERKLAMQQLAAVKEDRSRQSQPFSAYISGLSKQGSKLYNGYEIPKSFVTDINTAHAAAIKLNDAFDMRNLNRLGNSSSSWSKDIATQSKQAEQYLRSLGKQGFEYVNGEIRKTDKEAKTFLNSLGSLVGLEAKFYGIRAIMFGITGQFKGAVSAIIEYKQTVSEIAAITTATDAETKEYEKTISLLARSSKYAATEIASAMKVVAQSGIQRGEIVPVTRASELLAAATGGSPEAAANVVTTTLNVWQIAADKAIGLTNTMATAMKNSKLTVNDLAESFNYVASSAHAANMSVDETLSAIAAMRNKGVVASTVGTGLRQFMKSLEAPTPKVLAMFQDLELKAKDVDPKLRALGDILNDISERGIKKYGSELALSTKLSEAFEMRTGNAAKVIIGSGDAIKALTFAMKNSESGFLALERSLEGPQVKINKIKHEFMLFVQLVGEDLTKAISAGSEGLLGFVKGLQDTEVRMNVLGVAVGGIALAVVTGITAISASLKTLYLSNPWLAALTVAFTAYSAVVLVTAGNLAYYNKQHEEAFTKSKEEADLNQRQTNEMNKFIGTLGIVNGHKVKLNELTKEQKDHLDKLKPSMKGMLDHLDSEKSLVEQLLPLMQQLAEARGKNILAQGKEYNALKTSAQQKKDEATALNESEAPATKFNPAVQGLVKMAELDALNKDKSDPWKRSGSYMNRYKVTKPSEVTGFISSIDIAAWNKLRARDLMDQAAAEDKLIAKLDVAVGGLPKTKAGLVNIPLAEASVKNVDDAEEKKKRAAAQGYEGSDKFGREAAADAKIAAQTVNADIQAKKYQVQDLKHEIETLELVLKDHTTDPEVLVETKKSILSKLKESNAIEIEIAKEEESSTKYAGKPGNIAKVTSRKVDELTSKLVEETAKLEKVYSDTTKAQGKIKKTAADDVLKDEEDINKKQLPVLEKIMKDKNASRLDRQHAYNDALVLEYAVLNNEYTRKIEDINAKSLELPPNSRKEYVDQRTKLAKDALNSGKEEKTKTYGEYLSPRVSPMGEEKMANMTLSNLLVSLALQKDLATSARQVESIELDALTAKKDSLDMIIKIWSKVKEGSDDYDMAQEKIHNVTAEVKALNAEIAKKSNQSFTDNFKDGTFKAIIDQGTFKSNTEQLGLNTATTGLNGMVGVLQLSIDKIAQLKWSWSDFANSLGNTMKDIAKELETYLAKLMVIWMVEKAMGLINGQLYTEAGGNIGKVDFESGGGWGSWANGTSAAFAEGGQVPLTLGTPGVDSVPAMLTPGEIVIQKSTVDHYGTDKLLALNDRRIKGFAAGGLVGNRGAGSTNDGEVGNLTIINVADANSIPPAQPNETQIVNIVSFAMNKNAAFKQQIKNVAQGR